ncbi:carbon-nitrogen hydrolase family protein [Moorella sp. ACPs]|uniref:carbon-nitrogen hydrolase family protein n=1 Tax=Neomoorella carbonis TaxID=3062783 RepID=UPI003244FB76
MLEVNTQKINKKVMGGKEKVRVAAIQASQIVFNKEKSIQKACRLIKEAGANGAELVAFSETFIPVYPAYYTGGWESPLEEWMAWNVNLQDHSVVIPSEDTEIIGQACREAGVYCVMGVNELDDKTGSRTLYNTQIMFGKDGKVLGRHRKLMPTYTERTYWGWGDGSDLKVYDTDIGRIGSLICWEHHTILVRAAQMLMGEEFHISNWPGNWSIGSGKPGEKRGTVLEGSTNSLGYPCDLQFAIREYAFEAGSFVISVSGLLREEDFEPQFKDFITSDHMNFKWAVGGSAIVNPFGEYLAEPVFNQETILYADCYANDIKAVKAFFDGLGHYSRPDVTRLLVKTTPNENVIPLAESVAPPSITIPSYTDLKRISETFEVSLKKLETLATKVEELLTAASR